MRTVKVKFLTVIKYIESLGYIKVSEKGSHSKYKKDSHICIIVKRKNKETIGQGLLIKILKHANSDIDEFISSLDKNKRKNY